MGKKEMKAIAETYTEHLDYAQKTAIDTEDLVNQVRAMSGQDLHEKTVTSIINDDTISWEGKVPLIRELDSAFDQREENNTRRVIDLQSSQTQNVGIIIDWFAKNWSILLLGGLLLTGFSPKGRRAISYYAKNYLIPTT